MARVKSGDGYWMITPPQSYGGKKYIGGRYVYEHRLLVENKIGRLLKQEEIVDHVDGDRLNNNINNLQILSPVSHNKKHYVYKGNNVECFFCKKPFRIRPSLIKTKKVVFCSRKHYLKYVKTNNSYKGKNIGRSFKGRKADC